MVKINVSPSKKTCFGVFFIAFVYISTNLFWFNFKTSNSALIHEYIARIHSWNRPVLSNEGTNLAQ